MYTHARTPPPPPPHTHTHTQKLSLSHTHARTHARSHPPACTHAHTHMHARACTHTHKGGGEATICSGKQMLLLTKSHSCNLVSLFTLPPPPPTPPTPILTPPPPPPIPRYTYPRSGVFYFQRSCLLLTSGGTSLNWISSLSFYFAQHFRCVCRRGVGGRGIIEFSAMSAYSVGGGRKGSVEHCLTPLLLFSLLCMSFT